MSRVEPWSALPKQQGVDWRDPAGIAQAVAALGRLDGLVAYDDCMALRAHLGEVASARALVLQGGDCVETFARNCPSYVRSNLRLLARLGDSLSRGFRMPCHVIGRFAGQFAKPRTRVTDETGRPIWRGDLVNSRQDGPDARTPDPNNLLLGYDNSRNALAWARETCEGVYSSHEAILLEYESGLLRRSPAPDCGLYASSAHFLWVGYRTSNPDEAHVAFAASIGNAIGVKIGPETTASTFAQLCRRPNPERQAGRLTAIIRLAQAGLERQLPQLVRAAKTEGTPIVWMCDPMHANNSRTDAGVAVRFMSAMRKDIRTYVDVHSALGTWPGGLHLEMTSDRVFECQEDAGGTYEPLSRPAIDARLNAEQAEDLTMEFASALHGCLPVV